MNAFLESRQKLRTVLLLAVVALAISRCAQAAEPEEKAAIPSVARQAQVRKLLEETLVLSKASTTAKKQQAAQKLMEMASDSNTPPDELYVVLTTALPLLREIGDLPTYLKLVEQLVESFQITAGEERARYIVEYMAFCKSATTLEPVVLEVIAMANRAARGNHYRAADELLDAAEKQVKRLSAAKLTKTLAEVRQSLRGREKAFDAMTLALKSLSQKPDDSKANTDVGLWLAVYESDWEQARPMLLLGSDAKWKAAAAAEPTSPSEIEDQLKAADAWWEVAQSATGDAKLATLQRAQEWYLKYEPNAKSPLVKARITKKLEEISASIDPKAAMTVGSIKAGPSKSKSDDGPIPVGKQIDLLRSFKLPDHELIGKLQRDGNSVVANTREGIFMLPIAVQGSYEIVIAFTPVESEPFKCLFPVGWTSCSVVVGAYAGQVSGMEVVDGKDILNADTSTGAAVRPGPLAGGQRHELRIEVNQSGEAATIEAELDKTRITNWQGQLTQLRQYPDQVLPCSQAIGIWHRGQVEVHGASFRLKRGGKAYFLGDDWKNPVTQSAMSPPKEVASKCVVWKGRNYFFSDSPVTFGDAQRLAVQLHGRLLTISSADEEEFIKEKGEAKAHNYWQSGWRRANSHEWRDDRNRPLRFIGAWGPNQPELNQSDMCLQIWSSSSKDSGWHDSAPRFACHVCIEWGDEDAGK
ncbi:MAG TPA: hypothetical protein VGM98_10745 [Schlesneria sp.]|jgi:hypothetical protein